RTLLRPRSIVRNIIGLPVLLAGLLMLFLPGQGLLTVMIGLAIMVYPGKFRAERWLVRRQGVLRALNWMRKRRGVPPLDVDGFINE
ncbi:MAG: PGPGW domain-containing protein, partial [Gammaproteobacteria bacterium]